MGIADATAEGVFVCFDGVMTKLHNLKANEAGHLLAEAGVNLEDTQVPPFVLDMEGKIFNFQLRVSAYNFTASHHTFTITRIYNVHAHASLPEFVDNGGKKNNGKDLPGGVTVLAKVETEGSSRTDASGSGLASADAEPGVPLANPSSKVVKKARRA